MKTLVAMSVAALFLGTVVSPAAATESPQVTEPGNIWDTAPQNEG